MAPVLAQLGDFLSHWFVNHTMWTVLIVGVVIGTIAIALRLDHT